MVMSKELRGNLEGKDYRSLNMVFSLFNAYMERCFEMSEIHIPTVGHTLYSYLLIRCTGVPECFPVPKPSSKF